MLRLPERIHKRPFVVSISVLLTLFVVSGVLIFTLGLFGPSSDLMSVYVSSKDIGASAGGAASSSGGIGINLPYLPTSNLLKNPSFENKQYDQVYTVSGGTENAVYVQSDSEADTVYDDTFFVGGTVRIMSLDQDGKLVLRMQAGVTDFKINQLGLWTLLAVPSGAAEGQKVTSLSSSSTMTVAVGDKGLLISDVTSSDPTILDLGVLGNFVSGSCISDRFFAVTNTGSFAISGDGKTWNVFDPDPAESYSIHTVTSLGKVGIAAGDSGTILLCSGGKITSVPSGTTQALLTSASDGISAVVAGMNGTVLTTSNGVIFRELSKSEMPVYDNTPNWKCSDYRDGIYVLGGDKGQIAIGSYSAEKGIFTFAQHLAVDESGTPISIEHILLPTSGEIIVMDDTGSLYCSNDNGNTWKLLSVNSMKTIDEIGQTSSGKILLSQGVTSQTTQLFTRIQFDDVQSENIFQAGDMCFLQRSLPSQVDQTSLDQSGSESAVLTDASVQAVNADLWQGKGEGTAILMQDLAPSGGGSSSLHIVGSDVQGGNNAHYVSQIISSSSDAPFQKNVLYQIKVWLKQDGISNGEVMAWVSGKFESAGTTFTDVGSSWRQYSYTFFLPTESTGADLGEIRFNIGFTGQGELNIDKVYFGLESYAVNSLPDSFTAPLIHSSPKLIRLDNIGLGKMSVSSQAWMLSNGNEGLLKEDSQFDASGCNSIDASLSLVRDAGSYPWLVIGSAASQQTVDNLMGYLCGSITDPYGKLRIENGTAGQWSRQFSRLVIEISDSDGIFYTDLQRGAYVDYIISLIQSSPYYNDNKSKFVFIDGMAYEGGTMLSEADFHAGSLSVTNQSVTAEGITDLSFADAVSGGYAAYFDSIPRTPSRPQQGADEWIRSSTLSILLPQEDQSETGTAFSIITAAEYVQLLLDDLGKHTYTVLSDLEASRNGADADTPFMFSDKGSSKTEKLLSAQNNKTMLAVCALLSEAVNGSAVQIKLNPPITSGLTDTTTDKTVDQSGLVTYGFNYENQIYTIIANNSDQPSLFLLEADLSLKGVYSYRYSNKGELIDKTKLGQRNNRMNLLPGQVIVVKIPTK